jgi:hypothetical protein
LQSLNDLSAQSSFSKLWLEVLDMMEKFMKVKVRGSRTEKLQEAITEQLKNILLVMKASEYRKYLIIFCVEVTEEYQLNIMGRNFNCCKSR